MSETKSIQPKGRIIECMSCGAQFDEMLPKCPYCDTTSIKGAEAEYMNKLDDVREDMEDLGSVPEEETKKEFKKQGKFVLLILVVLGGIIGVIAVVSMLFAGRNKRDPHADYVWQQENYPILNELYEQEKYEELVEMYNNAVIEDKPIYSWDHYEFCAAMDMFFEVEEIWDKEQAGEELTQWDYTQLLYMGFRINNYEESSAYTKEDKEKLAPYIEKVREDFETRWAFTDEEREAFEKEAEENYGYISYEFVSEYIEEWMKRSEK